MFKKVYVEITNRCNLSCSFCIGNSRKKKDITLDEFKVIMDKLDGYTKYLYFHVMGEPLFHPLINELINLGSTKYFINITTNGYLINRIKDNKNIRQINISLHSFDVKYNVSLDDYLNNVYTSVCSLVKNGTIVKYRLWVKSKNTKQIVDFLENKYGVKIEGDSIKLADNVYFEVEKEFIWPSMKNNYFNEEGSCRGLRDFIGILVSGEVIPCCLDSAGVINLGNIYKDDLCDIINSQIYKEMKQGFLNNKKIHPLCKKCNFYDLRKNNGSRV